MDGTGGRVCWGISRGLGRSLMNLHYAHKSNPGKADDSTPIWGAGVSGGWSAVRHRFRKLFVSQDNSLKSMRLKGNPTAPAMRQQTTKLWPSWRRILSTRLKFTREYVVLASGH